jgi:hypothetical protein
MISPVSGRGPGCAVRRRGPCRSYAWPFAVILLLSKTNRG